MRMNTYVKICKWQKGRNIGMLYIGSGLANTKPVIGEERILAWLSEFTLIWISIKLAVESFFLWNMVLKVYIFKIGGRKWSHCVIKIRVEIEVTYTSHILGYILSFPG